MEITKKAPPTIEASLEPGFVFDPTDEVLVVDYLFNWIRFECLPCDIVIVDDVYRTEPWNILRENHREEEGYFLTQTKANHTAADGGWGRRKRKAGEGSYKIQSRIEDRAVVNNRITWRKNTFSYQRKNEGETRRRPKTSGWVMHEYEITSRASEWVLCRVKLSDQEIARRKKSEDNGTALVDDQNQQFEQVNQQIEEEVEDSTIKHAANY
ncbi:NAC domain-containing protein 19-like [Typha angustifolia]|uniref:NAC domain-containing protein 19-like n=1 Tax=Typha angustifolia TaxID=59011 RepID=UPI003C2E5C50